jgi:hypothetical protein
MADLAFQYPTNPEFLSINFTTVTPAQVTETFTGKTRRVGLGVTYYTWELQYPRLLPLEAGQIKGYLAQTFGQQYSFEIVLPKISYSALVDQTTTTPVTAAAVSAGAISATLSNCGANKNVLAAGDFFRFNNHTKVYMSTTACVSNGAGEATVFFSSACQTSVPISTSLSITAVPFTAIVDEPEQEFNVGVGGLTSMSVKMREDF